MTQGRFLLDRSIFEPGRFPDEPMSQREAFIWMVSEAAWKPTKVQRKRDTVELQRGQLCHSVRYMAEVFGWSKSRVNRFIQRLIERDTIGTLTGPHSGTASGTLPLVINICNYDDYQVFRQNSGTVDETASGTVDSEKRDKQEHIELNNEEYADTAPAREDVPTSVIREACLKAAGLEEGDLQGGTMSPASIVYLVNAKNHPCDLELDVVPAIQRCAASLRKRGKIITNWSYCHAAIIENRDARLAGAPAPTDPPASGDHPRGAGGKRNAGGLADAAVWLAGEVSGRAGNVQDAERHADMGADQHDADAESAGWGGHGGGWGDLVSLAGARKPGPALTMAGRDGGDDGQQGARGDCEPDDDSGLRKAAV